MEPLYIAVCEDNIEEQNQLISIIEGSGFSTIITAFTKGEDLLDEYQTGKFDLILMDIFMSGISGIETITTIRKIDENVSVAFTTSSIDYALESYRLEALKYIEKPIREKAVVELLKMVKLKKENTPRLTIKISGKDVSVCFNQILYIEQKAHNIFIYFKGGEQLQAVEKLENIANQFDEKNFFRCHKSYLVNLNYVKYLDNDLGVFSMKEGQNVHICRGSMSKAKKVLAEYLFNKTRSMSNK
jgi:DNA-binding LytR/AlgR family response regulator